MFDAYPLLDIARVLKPGGILSLTFDYGWTSVSLGGTGLNYDPRNFIRAPDDVQRHFFSCYRFEPAGHARFSDNGKRYLVWPDDPSKECTFEAVLLCKVR